MVLLVVIGYCHIFSVVIIPDEDDAPLLIYSDAVVTT